MVINLSCYFSNSLLFQWVLALDYSGTFNFPKTFIQIFGASIGFVCQSTSTLAAANISMTSLSTSSVGLNASTGINHKYCFAVGY